YNHRRPHQALANRTTMTVWRDGAGTLDGAAVDMTLRLDNAAALPTYPQPQQQQVLVACEARRRGVRWRLRADLFASPVSAFAGLVACLGVCLLAIVFVLCIRTAPVAMLAPPQAR